MSEGAMMGERADEAATDGDAAVIDLTSQAFARRLANLLAERRRARGTSLRSLARQSHHAFSARDLQAFESGRAEMDEARIDSVVKLYGADIEDILPTRMGLAIRSAGVLTTSGLTASFTPHDSTSLLLSYLKLIRQLRAQQQAPAIELRREDVEVLADYIGEDGSNIVERLGALMGATVTQRRAMAGMFLAGALVIGLAGGSVAAVTSGGSSSGDGSTGASTTLVVLDEHGAPQTGVAHAGARESDPAPAATTPAATTATTAATTSASIPATVSESARPAPVGEPGDGYGDLAAPAPVVEVTTTDPAAADDPPTNTSPGDAHGSTPVPEPTAMAPTTSSPAVPTTTTPGAPGVAAPTTPATTTPAQATPATPATPTDVGAGGSIFDVDVPTEASPIATAEPEDAKDEPAPVTDTGTAPDPGGVATDGPPVPQGLAAVASWQVLSGADVETNDTGVKSNGSARVGATDVSLVDGTVEVGATLINGPGFGVFVRSSFDERARVTSGWSVQVDTGWGTGALLVRRWSNDWEAPPVAVTDVARERLYGSHTLEIDIHGDQLRAGWNGAEVNLDLAEALRRLGAQWSTDDGDRIGVRAWGDTLLEVDRVEVDPRPA